MFKRIRQVGAGVASLAGLRTELFAVELREQLEHWLRVAQLGIAAVILGCFGLAFVAVFVTVLFWSSQPLIALGVFTLLFLGGAAWCAGRVSQAFANAPRPFAATISEFRNDVDALQGLDPLPSDVQPASGADSRERP